MIANPFVVPAEGEDDELDMMTDNAYKAMQEAKAPQTKEEVRAMIALRRAQVRGEVPMDYDPAQVIDPKPEEPAEPLPDLEVKSDLNLDKVRTADPYWWDKPEDVRLIDWFIGAASEGLLEGGLLIAGPAGVGKTESVKRAAKRLARRLLIMNVAVVTDPQKWLGRREITGDGTVFIQSDFLTAVQGGDIILLDDMSRAHSYILNLIMSLLDGQRSIHLPDMNININVNPRTVFIATANIGTQFGGTHRMDWAHRERFPYTLEREFPPAAEEARVIDSATNCGAEAAKFLVEKFAAITRQKWQIGDLSSPVSTRTLKSTGLLIASGFSITEALEYTALPLYAQNADGTSGSKSERTVVRGILEGLTKKAKA